jgi:hypothetical protein
MNAVELPHSQPGDDQQQRRQVADRLERRQHADQHRADRHQQNRDEQGGLAAAHVADAADDDAAERARQEAEPVGEEGRQQGRDLVARGKEFAREVDGDEGKDGEIVPFEHVADDGGGDGLAGLCRRGFVHGDPPPAGAAVRPAGPSISARARTVFPARFVACDLW